MSSSKVRNITLVFCFLLVPALSVLSITTKGAILPSLPGKADVFNINFLPFILAAALSIHISYKGQKTLKPRSEFILAAIINLAWLTFFISCTVDMWGEH